MTTDAPPRQRQAASAAGGMDLVLFTDLFPSGSGEAFLEPEIGILARTFARVTVVPRRALPTARNMPEGVHVDYSLAEFHRVRTKRGSLAAALGSGLLYRELAGRPHLLLGRSSADALVGQLAEALRTKRWLLEKYGSGALDPARTLVYSYWLRGATTGAALARRALGGRKGPRIISRAHGFDVYADRHVGGYVPLQRQAIEAADAVFTVSEHGRAYLTTCHPLLAERISVARLGSAEPETTGRGSSDGVFRVLTCARVEEVKRLDRVVEALAALGNSLPGQRVEWTHFGSGSGEDAIRGMAGKLLPGSVAWRMRGEVPNSEVRRHYATRPVDVLLSLSRSEGVPVSMMEAQSFGVPIVATGVGGVPEIVVPGTGVLLPADPAAAEVASALCGFMPHVPEVNEVRERARANWGANYRAEVNLERFVDQLVERFATGSPSARAGVG